MHTYQCGSLDQNAREWQEDNPYWYVCIDCLAYNDDIKLRQMLDVWCSLEHEI